MDSVSWNHESFPGCIKVSSNYQLCKDGNRLDNDSSIIYSYVDPDSKRIFDTNWNDGKIYKNIELLSEWEGMKKYVPKSHQYFLLNQVGRLFHGMPKISAAQRALVRKFCVPLYLQDDILEKLYISNRWWNLGIKYGQKICELYSGHGNGHPGMDFDIKMLQIEYDIPDGICSAINSAFTLHILIEEQLRKQLHPAIYSACCGAMRNYISCINIEQPIIQAYNGQGKCIEPEKSQFLRVHSNGIPIVVSSLLYDPLMVKYVDTNDSLLNTLCWIPALENDVLGSAKDVAGNDKFDPTSVTNYYLKEKFNGDQVKTFKYLLNQCNELKYNTISIINNMDPVRKEYFNYIHTFINTIIDIHLCTGVQELNVRYGWEPVSDN